MKHKKHWLTSDWHLHQKNIAGKDISTWKDGYRNFKDEIKMTDHIINSINQYVDYEDTLWFLGDFCFKDHKLIPEVRSRIVCKTFHFILGNHDDHIPKYASVFSSVQTDYIGKVGNYDFHLYHYPLLSWKGIHKGFLHAHGHCHSAPGINAANAGTRREDVGIDRAYDMFGEYRPFEENELADILHDRNLKFLDHHTNKTNNR